MAEVYLPQEYKEKKYLEWFDSRDLGFEMFTKAGNKKCKSIARSIIKKIFGKKRITREEILDLLGSKISKAYDDERYGEIRDSEPPYHIIFYIRKALGIAGYDFEVDRFDINY